MAMVVVDDSCLPKTGGLIHQMNRVNCRNDLGHDDRTVVVNLLLLLVITTIYLLTICCWFCYGHS